MGHHYTSNDFNPRAPCGARHCHSLYSSLSLIFQPTCPVRGTTLLSFLTPSLRRYFNPRAPCGARHHDDQTIPREQGFQPTCPVRGTTKISSHNLCSLSISTHVPRAGHDSRASAFSAGTISFQPTCPVRGTTLRFRSDSRHKIFQPTCPVRGTTAAMRRRTTGHGHFNPRAPCGARHQVGNAAIGGLKFQPTCPVRGTTCG